MGLSSECPMMSSEIDLGSYGCWKTRARSRSSHARTREDWTLFLLFLSYRIKRQQVLSCSSILRERYTRFELCHIISVGCRTGTDSFSECQNKRNMRGVIALHQLTQSQTSIIVCNELKLCQKPKAAKVRKISLRKYANIFSLRDGWNIGILFGKKQSHSQHENLP